VPGSFVRTTEAFRLLHARGVRTMMKTPLMHDNINQFQQLRELAEQLGAILRTDQIITSKLNGDPAPLRHRMTEEEQLAFMRATLDPKQWPHTVEQDEVTCLIGQGSLLIDPYGDVFPCAEVRLRAGNLRQQPLDKIWSASPIWQKVLGLVRSTLPVCHTCTLVGWCVRCHGGALNETRDLRGPSPAHCRAAHLRRQALIEELDEGDTIERHATTDTRSPWLAQQESKRAR
jgi:radical SAM protein with 4Fe4S-binding SPASM domain